MEINNNFWKNKKVLITGHTGFKGSWLSIILNNYKAKLYGISLKPEKKSLFNDAKLVSIFEKNYLFNLIDKKRTQEIIKKINPDIIFHFAAQSLVIESYKNPYKTYFENFVTTLNLLESLKNLNKLGATIFATTDKVYKNLNKKVIFKENDELGGNDPYSSSKVCCEELISIYTKFFLKNKIGSVTVRAGNVIGGGDWNKNRLIPDIIRSKKKNTKLIIRNPKHTRPWQHVFECLFTYILIAEKIFKKNKYNGAYNISSFNTRSYKVEDIINISKKIISLPKIKINKKSRYYESSELNLDIKKINKVLKIKNKTLNITNILKLTYSWYVESIKNKNVYSISVKNFNEFLKYK